jgi:hypothetical protein
MSKAEHPSWANEPERIFQHIGAKSETKECPCGNDVEYIRADLVAEAKVEVWDAAITIVQGFSRNIRQGDLVEALESAKDAAVHQSDYSPRIGFEGF